MKQQYDDTFLARWLSDELSDDELQQFKSSEDYEKYVQIITTLDTTEIPEFDVEANLQTTLQKLSSNQAKKRRAIPLWSYTAAASITIVFFVYSFFFSITSYSTRHAEQISFELPDNSKVYLNADSEVSFNKRNWDKNRSLSLKGEAFFKVEKGNTFIVNTPEGKVTVLGTQFIVNSRDNYYNVVCYEGKVSVVTKDKDSIVLTKGKAFSMSSEIKEEYTNEDRQPLWLSQQSSFKNTPILQVIEELERQYNITILGKENLKPANFTGSFPHTNKDQAVQIVFVAMDISYTKDKDGNVVIQNN